MRLRSVRRAGLALVLMAATGGCGEPPVDGTYIGEPLVILPLRVGVGPFRSDSMRVTLVWAADPDDLDQENWIEQGEEFEPLPAEDTLLRLFEPPPIPEGVGRILAYDTPDGRWRPGVPLLAVGREVLVYTPGTGFTAWELDELCCDDGLEACVEACTDDTCNESRSLLAIQPGAMAEASCRDSR